MFRKISNELSSVTGYTSSNNLYKYFKYYFDFYFPPEPDLQRREEREQILVTRDHLHEMLDDLFADQSFTCLLLGYTGIGKSTLLRHKFHIHSEKSRIIKSKRTLIIPFFGDIATNIGDISQNFASVIRAAGEIFDPKDSLDDIDFWNFINLNKPRILSKFRGRKFISKVDDLTKLFENDPFAYATFKLKKLLSDKKYNNEELNVNNVIIIIDDIESIKESETLNKLFNFSAKAYECLRNKEGEVHIKLLIAERPSTKKMLKAQDWIDKKEDDFYIDSIPSLKEIFISRNTFAIEHKAPNVAARKNWEESYNVLEVLLSGLEKNHQGMIEKLCNFNIRKSLRVFESALSHGTWFMAHSNSSGAFSVNEIRMSSNPALILKAIAYSSTGVFKDTGLEQVLVNPFTIIDDPLLLLTNIYVFAYMYNNSGEDFEIAYNYFIPKGTITRDLALFFPANNKIKNEISIILDNGFKKGIFLQSLNDNDKYGISPRGRLIWEMFNSNTCLLEIFRDDLWLDVNIFKNFEPSLKLNNDIKISESIKIVKHICSLEREFVKNILTQEQIFIFQQKFKALLVSRFMFDGINKTMRRISVKNFDSLEKKTKSLGQEISTLEKKLSNV